VSGVFTSRRDSVFVFVALAVGLAIVGAGQTVREGDAAPGADPGAGIAAEQILAVVHHDRESPQYIALAGGPSIQRIELPPPPLGEPPPIVRGVYLNAWVFGGSRLHDLIALADTTELNTFVIDVKDATGHVTYRSAVPTAIEIGANGELRTRNVRERLNLLHQHGIHPVARIVVAKDPLLAKGKPGWAIQHVDGGVWKDRFGTEWVDTHRDSVWLYAAEIAQEAVLLGFAEVQFDYIRFPDESPRYMDTAVFPARLPDESRREAIRRNLALLGQRVRQTGVPFTLDVFGLTTSSTGDMGIGQVWEDLVSAADVVLPMVYPSHYGRGAYGFQQPNAEPYAVVSRALREGLQRSAALENPARIRPFLQSFSIRPPRYTAVEIRAQINAVYDAGLTDWVLWNASGRYPANAFEPSR